jgi:hypothetical protein
MEIAIRPHDLAAAAAELRRCARDLEAAMLEFVGHGADDVVELGMKAIEASSRGLSLTDQAVRMLADDIEQLATGLREVAASYPAIDASAVPPR